jgi:hypothetical protein
MKSQSIGVGIVSISFALVVAVSAYAESKIPGPTDDIVSGEVKAGLQRSNEQTQAIGLGSLMVEPIRRRSTGGDGEQADTYTKVEKYDMGVNEYNLANIPIRSNQGFMQVMDLKETQDMLKGMINKKVPVLYQTMMMVENGAATGFIGSVASVNALLSSTMQASQLQLSMYEAMDPNGDGARRYIANVYNELQDEKHKDVWPLALWGANKDVLDPSKLQAVNPNPSYNAARVENRKGGPSLDPRVKTEPAEAEKASEKEKIKLSEVLFEEPEKAQGKGKDQYKNDSNEVKAFREEFVKLLGDIESEVQVRGGAQLVVSKFLAPTNEGELRALELIDRDNAVKAWTGLQVVLKAYCEFKAGDENYTKEMFEKTRPASIFDQTGGIFGIGSGLIGADVKQAREDASAPDIPLTINFIDQIFRLMVNGKEIVEKSDCDQFKKEAKDMPDATKDASGGSAGGAATFDDCKKEPKECLRNKVVLNAARIVARSRTLHRYANMQEQAHQFAPDPRTSDQIDFLIGRATDGVDIRSEIEANRELWVQFSNFISRLAQGQASSSIFRPGSSSSVPNQRAGAAN